MAAKRNRYIVSINRRGHVESFTGAGRCLDPVGVKIGGSCHGLRPWVEIVERIYHRGYTGRLPLIPNMDSCLKLPQMDLADDFSFLFRRQRCYIRNTKPRQEFVLYYIQVRNTSDSFIYSSNRRWSCYERIRNVNRKIGHSFSFLKTTSILVPSRHKTHSIRSGRRLRCPKPGSSPRRTR